jgi:hypothetical protein
LIVNILSPSPKESLKKGEEILVRAEVRMLWGCPLTPGGPWDSNQFEIWGHWVYRDKVSEKFNLKYAGKASFFEGRSSSPEGLDDVKLQILAADRVGNFGQHIIVY